MKKKLLLFIVVFSLLATNVIAQCTGSTAYDLTITDTTVLHPIASSYISAIVCPGAVLIDSASCCTRWVHVLPGGTYSAGGLAYGIVYVKSGGTFDAHNSTMFFGVTYETGATILNYSGPTTLCPSITFATSTCTSIGVNENNTLDNINVFYNYTDKTLIIDKGLSNSTISVFEVTGKKIIEKIFQEAQRNTFDVSFLSAGIYTYNIANANEKGMHGKFVIAK